MPDGFTAPPGIIPAAYPFWDAFWELSNDRSIGNALGPIPFLAIDRYASRYGIDDIDEFDRFRTLIRKMDTAYVGWQTKPPEIESPSSAMKSMLRDAAVRPREKEEADG